jgi:pantoate--beta-alanine ligase
MIIFKNADQIAAHLSVARKNNKSIGFVPTMGALHQGHLSLVHTSKDENDLTVCSIFINPAQFNNEEDFKHYPVTIEKDIELLIQSGCDISFYPLPHQIYPATYQKKIFDLGKIETILEGQYRPGHFQGVCQVMDRLLEIIQPDKIYMGQKDYQQCMIVQKLLQLIKREKEYQLIVKPTIREADGLAMSSRNLRLSQEDRLKATALYHALNYIKNNLGQQPLKTLQKNAKENLEKAGFSVDYVAIADAKTLEPASGHSNELVALVAANINDIRLIDNTPLN